MGRRTCSRYLRHREREGGSQTRQHEKGQRGEWTSSQLDLFFPFEQGGRVCDVRGIISLILSPNAKKTAEL